MVDAQVRIMRLAVRHMKMRRCASGNCCVRAHHTVDSVLRTCASCCYCQGAWVRNLRDWGCLWNQDLQMRRCATSIWWSLLRRCASSWVVWVFWTRLDASDLRRCASWALCRRAGAHLSGSEHSTRMFYILVQHRFLQRCAPAHHTRPKRPGRVL